MPKQRIPMPMVTKTFEVISAGLKIITNTKKEKLAVDVLIENGEVSVPIDDQFRKKFQKPGKKYAVLNKIRLQKIQETKPREIEVEYMGCMDRPFRVLNREIAAWFERMKQAIKSE